MNEERAIGIIVRVRPLTESSLIVHWLTREFGRIATVAKGAQRPKSPFRGKLDVFHLLEFSFARSRRSDLHTLREAVLRRAYPALRRDLARLQQAAYAVGLLELATESETPLPVFFELCSAFLEHLDQTPPAPLNIAALETKVLTELGLAPTAGRPRVSGGAGQILARLQVADWASISNLRVTEPQARELSGFLRAFLRDHLGRIPRGRRAALGEEAGGEGEAPDEP